MSQQITTQVPEGYKIDSKDRLVPIGTIKPIDLIKDEFVCGAIALAEKQQAALVEFKKLQMAEVDDFIHLIEQEHNVKMGGKKGNITLRSFNHQMKVVIQNQERIELGPELLVAKQLIDECLANWTRDGNQNIKRIIHSTFDTDKEGAVNPGRILALRKHEIEDSSGKWAKAMKIISESVDVINSSRFIRFYKTDEEGKEQAISLDISKL
jgi:hypothetical protein